MSSAVREPIVAGEDERVELETIERSLDRLQGGKARLIGPANEAMILPDSLYRVLVQAASQLAEGYGVAIMPYSQELTTQQAADLLNVSRPHVVSLLESGAMPFHRVGTHRRVYLKDLLEYKHRRDSARRGELQAMVDEAQELGVYDE